MSRTMTRSGLLSLVLCFVALALLPGVSMAAEDDPVVEVQFLVDGEQGSGFLLVTGTLPESQSLPATLTLPVPEGAELWWAGEIHEGGSDADVALDVDFDEDARTLSMLLEGSRTGQYDALYLPTISSGDRREAVLDWTQGAPASHLVFSVVMPAFAGDIDIDPLPASGPALNAAGESLFVLPSIGGPEQGSQTRVSASYSAGSIVDGGGPDGLLIGLGIALGVVLLVLGIVVRRSRASGEASDPYPVADTDDDAEDE